jgi:predicted DCC family thiol-disulfide oxidoreductase YuxK
VSVVRLTVLYDDRCPMCRAFSAWLERQPTLVELDLVPAGSPRARYRFPALDHDRTLEEITVVGDDGGVWTGTHAWVMCLWATAAHRTHAESLARPSRLPMAKVAAYVAAGIRHVTTDGTRRTESGCADACCAPAVDATEAVS